MWFGEKALGEDEQDEYCSDANTYQQRNCVKQSHSCYYTVHSKPIPPSPHNLRTAPAGGDPRGSPHSHQPPTAKGLWHQLWELRDVQHHCLPRRCVKARTELSHFRGQRGQLHLHHRAAASTRTHRQGDRKVLISSEQCGGSIQRCGGSMRRCGGSMRKWGDSVSWWVGSGRWFCGNYQEMWWLNYWNVVAQLHSWALADCSVNPLADWALAD